MVTTTRKKKRESAPAAPKTRSKVRAGAATAPSAPRKPRAPPTCTVCGHPMKGHKNSACKGKKLTGKALDRKAADVEEVVLAGHKDAVSRRIDAVIALVLEEYDGRVEHAAIEEALAEAGLTIPDGKTLADFIPSAPPPPESDDEDDVGEVEEDEEDEEEGGIVADILQAAGRGEGAVDCIDPAMLLITRPVPGEVPSPPLSTTDTVVGGAPGLAPDAMQVDAVEPQVPVNGIFSVVEKPKAKKPPTYRLRGGWKATKSGLLPLVLARNGLKKLEYPTQSEKAKRIPRMFQAMAQKGDTLASRADGWAFCLFMPKGGAGIMRTWHSDQVQQDIPGLPDEVRAMFNERLRPFREQYTAEVDARARESEALAQKWEAIAAQRQRELEAVKAQKDRELEALRQELARRDAAART
ncbi:hypothetical protein AURDEDRAFT_164960 [Auricularia subglabra TFB-10046 SS5]|nr:hypothetical protein AURDEDRAFT_164960 [Auricularia subglabra TFB-10046 SS5]